MGADSLGDGVGERLDALAASVERLARQNRRHRGVGGSVLLLAAGTMLMEQAPSPRVADEVRGGGSCSSTRAG